MMSALWVYVRRIMIIPRQLMPRSVLLAYVVLFSGLVGCTWVKLEEGAVDVALIPAAMAKQCERLGTTQATSKASVGMIKRNDAKVATEILTLAKNSAAEMGGNTISEVGRLAEGKQTFTVYRCPD
jgi:hypothetical protein